MYSVWVSEENRKYVQRKWYSTMGVPSPTTDNYITYDTQKNYNKSIDDVHI